jgi:hypothetical protein
MRFTNQPCFARTMEGRAHGTVWTRFPRRASRCEALLLAVLLAAALLVAGLGAGSEVGGPSRGLAPA